MGVTYTAQAQRVLAMAEKTASQHHHSYIGTEHLLVGLVKEMQGTAGTVLAEYEVEEGRLMELIDRLIAPEGAVATADQPDYTPRAAHVLEMAAQEAAATEQEHIGTEHILLAMLREADCVGTRLLYTMGVNIQKMYASLMTAQLLPLCLLISMVA